MLTILITNAMDFFSNRSNTVWAPIKLTRHDLLNAIYLEKVRHASPIPCPQPQPQP